MHRPLLIVLALSACASAMVRRQAATTYCSTSTPCSWSIYKTVTKEIELEIQNSYCSCEPPNTCQRDEDDKASSTFVHKCKPPPSEP